MKKLLVSLLLVFAAASSVFAQTYNDVKGKNKPVVVMFHMHGCSACRKISPMFDKISSKFSDKFSFAKDDIHNSEIAKTLNFATVPAIFIVEPKTMSAKRIEDNCAWDDTCFAKTLKDY